MNARRIGSVLVGAVLATGCATLGRPMPEVKGPLAVSVATERPSGWTDMPIGVHQIPDSSVYVSGHQGAAGAGAAFGLIGLAAAHAAASATGEKKAGDPAALRIDIVAETRRVLDEELGRRRDPGRFAAAGAPSGATLEVVPYVVLTFVGQERVRPWVVLKTALKDGGGSEQWKTRYMATLDEPRVLGGDDGWAARGGEPLRGAIDRALRAGVEVLLRDAAGQLARGQGRVTKVRGHWVWVKEPLEVSAEILEELPDRLVVRPEVPDGVVFAGISVLDVRAAGERLERSVKTLRELEATLGFDPGRPRLVRLKADALELAPAELPAFRDLVLRLTAASPRSKVEIKGRADGRPFEVELETDAIGRVELELEGLAFASEADLAAFLSPLETAGIHKGKVVGQVGTTRFERRLERARPDAKN